MNILRLRKNFSLHLASTVFALIVLSLLFTGQTAPVQSQGSGTAVATADTTGLIATAAPTFDGPSETIKVGTFGIFADAAIYIGIERGYFAEQGINVEVSQFSTPADLIPALATGQLDVGNGGTGAALFNALGSNLDLKIVADNATIDVGKDGAALVVRKDLGDTVKTPADWKGRKIGAVAAKGTASQIYLEKLLVPAGLSLEDVQIVQLPFPGMVTALANGAVDGAILVEPFLSLGLSQGIFTVYKGIGDIYPGQEANVEIYAGNFAKKTDLAQRFAIARLKAVRDYNDAFFKNKDRDAIVTILTKHTAVKDAKAYAHLSLTGMDPNGKVGLDSLAADLAWYSKNGFVTQTVDLKTAVDSSFVDNAVKVLGIYK